MPSLYFNCTQFLVWKNASLAWETLDGFLPCMSAQKVIEWHWQVQLRQANFIFVQFFYGLAGMLLILEKVPVTFRKKADNISASVCWKIALFYIDSISVCSESQADHIAQAWLIRRPKYVAGIAFNMKWSNFYHGKNCYLGAPTETGLRKPVSISCDAVAKLKHLTT